MKTLKKKFRKLIVTPVVVLIGMFFVATACAAVSFIKPQVMDEKVDSFKFSEIPATLPHESKAHAPEPATMALFGSGFLGMIIGFVRRTYAIVKRIFDVTASIFGFIVLSPLILLTAIVIKLTSRGPVLYSQIRVGKDEEPFEIYKFRTMKADAEKETGPVWAAQYDNRLTSIGGFLRRAHIDELPQLLNVLRGEMSIIGPRPERPVFVDKLKKVIPDYGKRLAVKPGITGLAQVWHRYDESIGDVKKKIKYDLLYIKKICLWTDIRILFRTVRVVITGEGAR